VKGTHRLYSEADVERLRELVRLRDLLGLSLEELREVLAGEDARAARRAAWDATEDPAQRRRMLAEARAHVESLLAHVSRHKADVETYETELLERLERIRAAGS
jgi:DNA-binding transcriptional MerR regulator